MQGRTKNIPAQALMHAHLLFTQEYEQYAAKVHEKK